MARFRRRGGRRNRRNRSKGANRRINSYRVSRGGIRM